MKILYIAQERLAARLAAHALRRIAPDITLCWAQTADAALGWMRENHDASAVILDPGEETAGSIAVLETIRGLGIDTPIAVLGPEHLVALSAAVKENLDVAVGQEQAQHDAVLARTTGICTALQQRLFEVEAALHDADRRHAAQTTATEQLAAREAELSAAVVEAVVLRASLEFRLAGLETAHQHSRERAAAELAAADERYASLEHRFARETVVRTALEERLAAAGIARENLEQEHARELASLTAQLAAREAEQDLALVRSNRICTALQERLLDLEAGIHAADERHTRDAAAAERLAGRENELRAALADAAAARTTLEERLAEALTAWQRAAADATLAGQRCAAFEQQVGIEAAGRSMLEERLAAAESARHDADQQHEADRASWGARLADVQARHQAAAEQTASVERQLGDTVAALEQARRDWTSERTAAAARQAAVEGQLAVSSRDLVRQQQETAGLRRHVEAIQARADAVRRDAQRVPALQLQLEESQKEIRRQFERAPYGLCECTSDGAITRVNYSFARLLGYRTPARQRVDFVAAVFESVTDFRWLLQRALQSGRLETVETTLRTRDCRRLFVRLHAAAKDGSVVIAVEDLTSLCAVEQRLREAQRMEAVGRVASEVAATCDTLLRDVSHGGRQWLAGIENDTLLRHQGELLLADVTRAAAFLRQFVIYGHKQISNLEPVSMRRVLWDMKPVLKRILGDEITLVLPKTMDGFDVDVDAERVERMLVNVANCARERMPQGGRVRIQLAATVVDHQFLASHPKVRPGAHVLLTVTETRGAVWPALAIPSPTGRAALPAVPLSAPDKPGMDVGPLVALISGAGGHFWMSAEPSGNVTLRIHLPQRTQVEVVDAAPTSLLSRGRQLTRWFRH